MPITPRSGDTGARAILQGTISNGVTWREDVAMTEDGVAIGGTPASWTWSMRFRCCEENDSTEFTLTTGGGGLTISQGSDATTLQIRVARATVSNRVGDYIVDIKSIDTSDTTDDPEGYSVHWAHGMVTVRNEP